MKNMDPLNDNVATLLHQSTDKFVAELWKDGKSNPLFNTNQPNWNILFLIVDYILSTIVIRLKLNMQQNGLCQHLEVIVLLDSMFSNCQ